MDEFWRESFVARGIDGFDMMSYPLDAPITCRPDWRVKGERPGSSLANMQRDALDAFGIGLAICNPLHRRPGRGQRDDGCGDLLRGQRLDHRALAEQGTAAARLHRGAGAGAAARGGGDRAPRRRPALRADPDAGGVRDDARPQLLLADLRGGGEARSADRPARRQHVPLRADLRRLAVALSARLRGELADLRGSVAQPDLQRRVQSAIPTCASC